MFIFKNKKIHVDCFTNIGIYATDNPIQKASNFIPQWYKNLKTHVTTTTTTNIQIKTGTMKTCSGFVDLYNTGLIIPMWSDLNFRVEENNFFYQFASNMGQIQHHQPYQYNNAFQNFLHFKITTPWYLREKTGVQFVATSCLYTALEKMPKLSILTGMLNFKYQATCNINGFASLDQQPYQYDIEAGTPMIHILPMSDKDVVPHIHVLSENEYKKMSLSLQPYKFSNWGLVRQKLLKNKNKTW